MSRLVDTTICPDCRGILDPSVTCSACGLQVRGPLALQLWDAMVVADGLIERLRRESQPKAQPVARPVAQPQSRALSQPQETAHRTTEEIAYPTHPGTQLRPQPEPKPSRLPSASVPVVLLTLGALCLLVAAIVFIAVTWNVLGLTGRTVVLLVFTGMLATVSVVLSRKGLRAAAETLWLVVAGMLTVDLLAAQSAGLAGLDVLSTRGTAALVGGALLAMGVGVGVWARRQEVGQLYGVQGVAVIGALALCSTNAWDAANPAIGTTIAIPLLAGAFLLLRSLVPVAAYGLGALAGASWLVLLGVGLDRSAETVGLGEWWADFRGWPLLAAALFAAVVAHLPWLRQEARSVAAGLALVPLVLLVNAPATIGTDTRDLLLACATLGALGLVTAFAPRAWAQGAAALTALGVLLLGLLLAAGPWPALSVLDPGGSMPIDLTLTTVDGRAAAWTAGVVALTVVLAGASLLTPLPARSRVVPRRGWSGHSHLPCSHSVASWWCSSWSPRCGRLSWPRGWRPPLRPAPPGGPATRPSLQSSAAVRRRTSPSSRCTPPRPRTCSPLSRPLFSSSGWQRPVRSGNGVEPRPLPVSLPRWPRSRAVGRSSPGAS